MKKKIVKNVALLSAGAFFFYFTKGTSSFALAAWLYPVCMLQVSRRTNKIYACLVIPAITGVVSQLSLWKFTYDSPSSLLFYIPFLGGTVIGLLFYIDRILYTRLPVFLSTLGFPLLYTTFEFLVNLFNPFGTIGLLGYSQFDFLSFSQLASITGMWGLTFIITWFAPVVFWVLENYAAGKSIKKGLTIYLSILISILIHGSIRLSMPISGKTVTITGIHTYDRNKQGEAMWEYLDKGDLAAFKKISDVVIQRLISATILQANARAKIIVWSEISPNILKEDEPGLLNAFGKLAADLKIYLVTTPYSTPGSGLKPENKTVVFSPTGSQIIDHYKYGGSFIEGTIEGDKVIKSALTQYGKIATIICWDGDFPSIVKQVGKSGTDILIIPASDWKEIDPAHAIVAAYRGIENGCSVVRHTQNGMSFMTDPRGKFITQMNHFTTSDWVMTGQVPTKRWFALYPIIGDLFGWLAIVGSLWFIILGTMDKKAGY